MNLLIRKSIISLSFLFSFLIAQGQTRINALQLPIVERYQLLRCDFHMHTVFSDGDVWPTVRVDEAFAEGLDAIAITDHVENTRMMDAIETKANQNTPYKLAEKAATAHNIILIRGCEISKDLPAGHYNALFVKDVEPLRKWMGKENKNDQTFIRETLEEVKNQGGITLWNHPWSGRKGFIPIWEPIQQELYEKGLFQGISVGNGGRFDPMVLEWCLDKNLTVYSNTDAHHPIQLTHEEYRNQTIVFAKERSQESIKEALIDRMSVAYFRGNLLGKEELLKLIVDNSIETSSFKQANKKAFLKIKNKSGVRYEMRLTKNDSLKLSFVSMANRQFVLEPFSEYIFEIDASEITKTEKQAKKDKTIVVKKNYDLEFTIKNLYIGQKENYKLRIPVTL